VEERPDATNVNNWHWAEKNADSWSKKKIEDLFNNLQLSESGVLHITVEGVESCQGEARVHNRKGKIIVFFEWNIILNFRGFVNWQGKEVRGKLEILNFSEDIDDLELKANVLLDTPCSVALTKILEKGAIGRDIRDTLDQYVSSLQTHYCGHNVQPPATTVKSRTMITESKSGSNSGKIESPGTTKSSKKRIIKRSTKKTKNNSDDFLFYLSLISIVGFSAVIAIKLVNRL